MKLEEIFQIIQEGYGEPYSVDVRGVGSSTASIRVHIQEIQIPNDNMDTLYYQLFDKYGKACQNLPKEQRGNDPIYQKLREMGKEDPNFHTEVNQICEIFITLLHAKLHEYVQKQKENMNEISQAIDQMAAQNQQQGPTQ